MFKNRETLLENIAFMAIISAINIIFSALSTLYVFVGIFIIIFLPFLSACVSLTCKWKYYPIYAFASIGLSLVATLWNMEFTIFYLIPSIITGFLFGFCFKKELPAIYSLLLTSIAHLILTCAFIPLINFIFNTDLINTFIKAFKLENKQNINVIILSFIYLLSLVQMIFSYIILNNELKKFNYKNNKNLDFLIKIIGLVISLLVILFSFYFLNIAYLFMFIALFISVFVFIDLIFKNSKFIIIISSIALGSGLILFFALFSIVKMPYSLLLINTSNILLISISLVYNHRQIC